MVALSCCVSGSISTTPVGFKTQRLTETPSCTWPITICNWCIGMGWNSVGSAVWPVCFILLLHPVRSAGDEIMYIGVCSVGFCMSVAALSCLETALLCSYLYTALSMCKILHFVREGKYISTSIGGRIYAPLSLFRLLAPTRRHYTWICH